MTNASNLLPWHPRRLDDEILSSWMLSIASGNGISVRSLCAWLGTDDWVREIDSMDSYNPLVNHIAEAAGVEKEIVITSLPSGLYGLFGKAISSTGWKTSGKWRLLGVGNQTIRVTNIVPSVFGSSGTISFHGLSPSIVAVCSTSASFEITVLIAERDF